MLEKTTTTTEQVRGRSEEGGVLVRVVEASLIDEVTLDTERL